MRRSSATEKRARYASSVSTRAAGPFPARSGSSAGDTTPGRMGSSARRAHDPAPLAGPDLPPRVPWLQPRRAAHEMPVEPAPAPRNDHERQEDVAGALPRAQRETAARRVQERRVEGAEPARSGPRNETRQRASPVDGRAGIAERRCEREQIRELAWIGNDADDLDPLRLDEGAESRRRGFRRLAPIGVGGRVERLEPRGARSLERRARGFHLGARAEEEHPAKREPLPPGAGRERAEERAPREEREEQERSREQHEQPRVARRLEEERGRHEEENRLQHRAAEAERAIDPILERHLPVEPVHGDRRQRHHDREEEKPPVGGEGIERLVEPGIERGANSVGGETSEDARDDVYAEGQ